MDGRYLHLILTSLISFGTGYLVASMVFSGRSRIRSHLLERFGSLIKVVFVVSSVLTGYYLASVVMPVKAKVYITSIDYVVIEEKPRYKVIFLGYVANYGEVTAYDVQVSVTWTNVDGSSLMGFIVVGEMVSGGSRPFEISFTCGETPSVSSYYPQVTFSSRPR
jgi:hypothetical protein